MYILFTMSSPVHYGLLHHFLEDSWSHLPKVSPLTIFYKHPMINTIFYYFFWPKHLISKKNYNKENNDNKEKLEEVEIRVYRKTGALVSRRPTHQLSWL